MKKALLPLFLLIFLSNRAKAQDLYQPDSIQQIEISFWQSNWDYILDTAKQGFDTYTMAEWVKINGVQFDSAGVKYKGNSSYKSWFDKNPLHIELDHFKNQDYQGIKDIKLSNGFHEPSSIREALLYKIARQYMPASRANYASVTINDTLRGLYTNVEAITRTFLEDRFYTNDRPFVFADKGGCDLMHVGSDSTLYYTPYTMKSDYGWTRLMNLCDTLKNFTASIENILDVDRTLWMLAFSNVTVTLDSYIGSSQHNYYMYQDHNGRFNPILWDLNGGFGVYNKAMPGPGLSTSQMQSLPPLLHGADPAWPLVSRLLSVPLYRRVYIAHMRTIVNENFADSSYYSDAQDMQSLIDASVLSDPFAFYTHAEFLTNFNNTVVDSIKIIPGIAELMDARVSFLNGTPEFMQVPPVISAVNASDTTPLLNDTLYITAAVTGANNVYLGKRAGVMDRFTRQMMLDDGLHGDGAAGDNVYGIDVIMDASTLQYYIYADNATAGMFSPERAEYEFYDLMIEKGVVLNELQASNVSTVADPYSEYDDWIELYNNSSSAVDLSGYHLSDNAAQPSQWTFPAGTVMAPGAFLVIWTDEDTLQTLGLHANFKLSDGGETVLFSNAAGQIIDEVAYPNQSPGMSYGRYVNGTGSWNQMNPTHNGVNSPPVSVPEGSAAAADFNVYPNPASDALTITSEQPGEFYLYTCTGSIIQKGRVETRQIIDLSRLAAGVYLVRMGVKVKRVVVVR